MYYHCRNLKYVVYDKIYPAPLEATDEDLLRAYQWLGTHCGYCPQIWLSRSRSQITGYKSKIKAKNTKRRGSRINNDPGIMFAFDFIKGFPVDFNTWCLFLNTLINCKDPVKNGNEELTKFLDQCVKWNEEDNVDSTKDDTISAWIGRRNLDLFLKEKLFVENDQVVLPSLNLKAAKTIYCRDEHQVKTLRNMGFIKDRIKILKSKCWD